MKFRVSEVRFIETRYEPFGTCEEEDCLWDTRFQRKSAKLAAKDHVAYTGHYVKVVTETIANYWAPEPKEVSNGDGGDRSSDGRTGAEGVGRA